MTPPEPNGHGHSEHSILKTWVIVLLILSFIVFKDGLSYFVVGDLGQPDWDYRPAKDVPGESAYAIYPSVPYPQHVRGAKGE
jgi:hypothetical protein